MLEMKTIITAYSVVLQFTIRHQRKNLLNNIMTVFKSEVDNAGSILNEEWEWK
jgi:hypothetical protein